MGSTLLSTQPSHNVLITKMVKQSELMMLYTNVLSVCFINELQHLHKFFNKNMLHSMVFPRGCNIRTTSQWETKLRTNHSPDNRRCLHPCSSQLLIPYYIHTSRRFNYKIQNKKSIDSLECQNPTVRYMQGRVDCVTLKSNPKNSPWIVDGDASIAQLSGDNSSEP